jgi:hypothetical protein
LPALPSVPGVLRVHWDWQLDEDLHAGTRLDFSYTGGPPSNTDCHNFAVAIVSESATHLIPLLCASYILNSVDVTDLSSPSGGFGSAISGASGTRSGDVMTVATCVLANYQIPRRYRGGKPRSYWPFGTNTDQADNRKWTSGAISAFLSGIDAQITAMLALTTGTTDFVAHVNVSYYEGFTSVLNPVTGRTKDVAKLRSGGPVVDLVTGASVNAIIGTQRRRYQR